VSEETFAYNAVEAKALNAHGFTSCAPLNVPCRTTRLSLSTVSLAVRGVGRPPCRACRATGRPKWGSPRAPPVGTPMSKSGSGEGRRDLRNLHLGLGTG
jgi:hypothetical protein